MYKINTSVIQAVCVCFAYMKLNDNCQANCLITQHKSINNNAAAEASTDK